MEVKAKEEQMEIIRKSIGALMKLPDEKEGYSSFMAGYNAVYLYCTEATKEKYVIEGAEIYKAYDQALIKQLKKLPEDYTLETFMRFVDRYIRANERICKMLSFLSRYFIRINIEISNTNVIELKKLYYERLFSIVVEGKEQAITGLFIDGIIKHTEMRTKKIESKSACERHLRILRLMLRTYIKMCKMSNQKKPLKKFLNSIARFIATLKDKEDTRFIYYRIAVIDSLFKKKEKIKKNLYRMVEEKIDESVLKGFIEGFVSKMMSSGITRKTHNEILPFYSFIDNSEKGKSIFINTLLLMSIKIVEKTEECSSFIKFSVFMRNHLSSMPRTYIKVKKPFEMLLTRGILNILSASPCRFENEILECIDSYMKTKKPPVMELSLFVSNVSADKSIFWKKLILGVKNRLILGNASSTEKKLISIIIRRIEQYKERHLKKELCVNKKVIEYIDPSTLYNPAYYYDPSNFEELLLCIKDVAISELYFRTEKTNLKKECLLLVYTRWGYPVMNMNIPTEIEDLWADVNEYCTEKGRKYILRLCPTVSSITLELNGVEIQCDMVQGSILILLTRGGAQTLNSLLHELLVEITDRYTAIVQMKIQTLLDASLIREIDQKYEINPDSPDSALINIFAPEIEDAANNTQVSKYAYSRGTIEAYIVKTLKHETGMNIEKMKEKVTEAFPVEEQEIDMYIVGLQEKGLISRSDDALYFIP